MSTRDVRNLNCGKRLDVNLRMFRLELAEHLAVVVEARVHVEAADDVELLRQTIAGDSGFVQHLLQ